MHPRTMRIALFILFITDGLVIGALVGGLSGSWRQGVLVGVIACAAPWLLVAPLILAMARASRWTRLSTLYPLRAPNPDATPARLTSIAVRWAWLAFNNCMEVRTDDDHLHLAFGIPMSPRMPVSIPWAAVTGIGASRQRARLDVLDGPSLWVDRKLVEREVGLREEMGDASQGLLSSGS